MKTIKAPEKGGKPLRQQAGGFVMGLVAGLLIGLAVALGVALYITKAPSLFVNKVPQRTVEQDTAETERNRNWDPNAPLSGKAGNQAGTASGTVTVASAPTAAGATPAVAPPVAVVVAPASAAATAPAPAPAAAPAVKPVAKDPAAILAGGPVAPPRDPFVYFVQTGAYTRSEDAEQQKAKLALIGQTARITEREQAGRTVYRVRLGPYGTREEADTLQGQLQEQTIEAQIVRVEKP